MSSFGIAIAVVAILAILVTMFFIVGDDWTNGGAM